MKKIKLLTLFAALLCAVGAWAWSGSGTAADPYLIANASDWNTLATNSASNTYSGTYFKLTDDITVSEMVGTDGNRFAGTFNGNGHTLTFNQGTAGSRFSEQHCGPFRYISGATIKCLHIAGTIYTSNQFAGVVGRTSGTNYFISCRSSLTIDCSKSGDGTNGGFIGVVEGTRTYFTNCLFDGQLLGSSSHSNGGFCGWSQNGVTLTNCLFAPSSVTFSASSSKTFSRGNNVSDSNCYYKQQYGDAQGTNAGSMSNEELQEALGTCWEISGGKVVPIISLRALTGEGTELSPYLIGSATDWDNLAVNVALGETYSGKFFKLTNNITVSEMVGLDQNNRFAGTFDGDGYTLTFNKGTEDSRFAENFCAPFRYTRGASLKNLIIEGTIYTSAQFAAVLGNAHGDTYINNCRSSIVINSSKSGDGTHGGFIGVTDDGHNHFTNCVFNGKMVGSNTNSCGGFVGWTDAIYGPSYSDFTNCLFAPAELTIGSSGSATFSRGNGNNTNNITCINCYYASSFGTAQGEQVYSVVGVSGMTVAIEGTPTATYNVSGLTFYGADKGFIFDGTIYGGNGDALSLNLSGSTGYKPSAGTLTGADPYTLTMADANTIIYPAAVIGDPNNADQITAFLDYYDGQNVAVLTIERPVLNNMYNTLCLPFDMDEDQIAASSLNGFEIYELEDVSVVNDELYLYTGAQKNAIVAGRPYLVKFSDASQLDQLTFASVVVNNANLNEKAVTIKGVTFTGTFQPVVLGAQTELNFNGGHLFLAADNTLLWPNTNSALKPFRAYFTVNVDAGQAAGMPMRRGMPAHIGQPAQMPTGVDNVQGDKVQSTKVMIDGVLYIIRGEHMYDAQGQMVK